MNTVFIKGGLGNQLYQVAAINAFSKDNNKEFFIDYSIRHGAGQGNPPKKYKNNFFKHFKENQRNHSFKIVQQKRFNYDKIIFEELESENILFDGYFQSWKYFNNYKDELNQWFGFDENLYDEINEKLKNLRKSTGKKIVGVHRRGGDYYKNQNIHPIIQKSYFDEAKTHFKNHIFLYATDDFNSTRNNGYFKYDKENIFVNGKDEIYDFYTLMLCDSLIISNSSFSAWASYLGNRKEQVIAPSLWFGEEGPDYSDLLDDSWKIIKTDFKISNELG